MGAQRLTQLLISNLMTVFVWVFSTDIVPAAAYRHESNPNGGIPLHFVHFQSQPGW